MTRRNFLRGTASALVAGGMVRQSGARPTAMPTGPEGPLFSGEDILIQNGFLLTMDRNRTVYPKGNLYIKNGRIAGLGPKFQPASIPDHVIDADHKLVLPGFINTHAHLQQYFRGTYELIGDFYHVNLPLEGYRSPEDMTVMGDASCAELIFGGCTTSLVIYTYPAGFARAAARAGNRVVLAADIEEVDLDRLKIGEYSYLPEKGEAAFQRARDLFREWHGRASGRITTCLCPKAADLVRRETYLRIREFAREQGLRITTHLSQTWREVRQVKKMYGLTPPRLLQDLGLMNENLTGVHCDFISEADLRLIKQSGMGILQCRSVGSPVLRWMDMGIPLGLGTDDYHHDMLPLLREIRTGQLTRARLVEGAEGRLASSRLTRRPEFYELLELATRRGAEVLGLDGEIGSLEAGKKADVITVDLNNPYLTPTREPVTSFVLYGSSRDIDNVIVDGCFLKRDGRLTTIDMPGALAAAQIRAQEIIDRFFSENPGQRKNWEKKIRYKSGKIADTAYRSFRDRTPRESF